MNKFFNFVAFSLSFFIFSGCATMQHNYSPTRKIVDFPKINTSTKVYLGEPMLIRGELSTTEILEIDTTVVGGCYTLPSGEYIKKGRDSGRTYFDANGSHGSITRENLCDPFTGLYVADSAPTKICVIADSGVVACYDASFSITKKDIPIAGKLRKILYFSGKKGDEALFMYTEKNGMETVHTQNFTYSLNDSPLLRYKGAKIKVIEYRKDNITYEVLENFPERNYY